MLGLGLMLFLGLVRESSRRPSEHTIHWLAGCTAHRAEYGADVPPEQSVCKQRRSGEGALHQPLERGVLEFFKFGEFSCFPDLS